MILNRGDINGAVRQMTHWLPRLDGRRFETAVAFLRDPGPWGERLLPPGACVWANLLRCRLDVAGMARLGWYARVWRPDVVFSIDERNATILTRWVGMLTGAAVVHAVHSTSRVARSPWWDRMTRGRVCRFVALSADHVRHLHASGVPPDRTVIVPNGVEPQDPEDRPRSPGSLVVFVFAGVLRRDKRVDVLLDAVARCAPRAPLLRLLIAGDGPETLRLRETTRKLGIESRVIWRGWADDVTSVYREADIVALPSDPGVETLSMVALEAMAVGIPVIATDVGSMGQAITPDVGILVPPGDPTLFSHAMMRLYEDESLRAAMGRAAWRRQRQMFSAATLRARMETVLADAAQSGRERSVRGNPAPTESRN